MKIAGGYRIGLVLFDFDGTLTAPGVLDFGALRRELGCPEGLPVLEFIAGIADPRQRRRARALLNHFEAAAAARSQPNPGAEALVSWLKTRGLRVAILTRNSRAALLRALKNFSRLVPADFDLLLTRDDPLPPKPAGDGVRHAAERLGVPPGEVLVVGDFYLDMEAGRAAGAMTVLLDALADPRMADTPCDHRIGRLEELRPILEAGLPVPAAG